VPDNKEAARKLALPVVVFDRPDVCKSPFAPVPYPIFAPLDTAFDITPTVRGTRVPIFTLRSKVPLVIGDEGGIGFGVQSGTFSGTGLTWPTGSSSTVRAEKFHIVRNGDPFQMNGGNTTGTLVYMPGGAPRATITPAGRPNRNTNPNLVPTKKEQGWLDWMGEKAGNAWDGTKQVAGDAWDGAKALNNEYKLVPRALGGLQAAGGAGEMVLGGIGLLAPTGVTQVLGGAVGLHGIDNAQSGLRTLWSGEFNKTVTEQAIGGTARALGASEGVADTLGTVGDTAAGLVNPTSLGRKLLGEAAEKAAKEAAEKAAKEAAEKAAKEAAEKAAKEGATVEMATGVRVLKKPVRPDTSKVKYPDDMSPYKKADGSWDWPANKGFDGTPVDDTAKVGQVLDRFGENGGKFLSPPGTPFDARALSPDSLTAPYKGFEVLKEFPIQSGPIAPAFGMPGGGTQIFTGVNSPAFPASAFPRGPSIQDLIQGGYLRELP